MHRIRLYLPALFCALLVAVPVQAQIAPEVTPELAHAQQRYDKQIARCNRGKLPEPARRACVREAGHALDRARGGPARNVAEPSANGRAIVVTPAGAPQPSSDSTAVTTPNDRATIVLPADGSTPRPQ